jgi:hypothetical protein
MDREFTMLLGAIEYNWVLDTDSEDAQIIRDAITRNEKLRKPHERYS